MAYWSSSIAPRRRSQVTTAGCNGFANSSKANRRWHFTERFEIRSACPCSRRCAIRLSLPFPRLPDLWKGGRGCDTPLITAYAETLINQAMEWLARPLAIGVLSRLELGCAALISIAMRCQQTYAVVRHASSRSG